MKRSRLLSALGFHHMQSAPDRDDSVKINFENIESNRSHNFREYNSSFVSSFSISYDYMSIMHYSSEAFSKGNNIKTIEPQIKNDVALGMGQRESMTEKDVLKLNLVYKCAASGAFGASAAPTVQPILMRSNIYCLLIFINYYSYYYYC